MRKTIFMLFICCILILFSNIVSAQETFIPYATLEFGGKATVIPTHEDKDDDEIKPNPDPMPILDIIFLLAIILMILVKILNSKKPEKVPLRIKK